MAERRLTELELERLLAGDYPAERARALEAAMSAGDRERLAALRAEREAFLGGVDVEAEARAIRSRLPTPLRRPRRAWVYAGAAALAAAAAVVLLITRDGEDEIGIKGDEVALVLHVAEADGSRRLSEGDAVRPGDRIRFEVHGAPGFVAVVGIDARSATVYYPFGESTPAPYDPAVALLPGAIELDETLGEERIHVLHGRTGFALEEAVRALRAGTPLPVGVSSAAVTIVRGR